MSQETPRFPAVTDNARLEKPSQDLIRKYWKVEKMEVNGKSIELIGVAHHPETLNIPEYREKLESAIKGASLVVLEAAPTTRKIYSLEEIQKLVKSYVPDLSDEEIAVIYRSVVQKNPASKFFEEMETLAARAHKDIATIDPNEDIYKNIVLQEKDSSLRDKKFYVTAASLTAALGLGLATGVLEALEKQHENKASLERNPTVSRRTLLKGMLGAAVIGAAGGSSLYASSEGVTKERDQNPMAIALYDMTDYRDAVVAEGLEQLSREMQGQGSIEVIYGGKHLAGIRHYLQNPRERKLKLRLYVPFDEGEEMVKTFTFHDTWKRKSS